MNISYLTAVALLAGSLLTLTGCPTSTVKIESTFTYNDTADADSTHEAPVSETVASDIALPQLPVAEVAAEPATTEVAQAEPAQPEKKEAPKKEEPKNSDANPSIRPKADRTPRKPGEPIKITFDNIILGMQANMVYRPWMLKDEQKELDGQRVSLTGVMYPGDSTKFDSFILLRNKECKYGDGGQADHLADIKLTPGTKTTYHGGTVRVEGVLRVRPDTREDFTWSVYVIDDAKVTIQQ
ncbi:hypothetical protein NA78x_001958 [Anatilimnocola sp. NA78]|uniref:hypothetical protein n=1 Tax=Anatilimnocola sp. NA78 TaxID=3415683 RepID=UPI003CE4AC6C